MLQDIPKARRLLSCYPDSGSVEAAPGEIVYHPGSAVALRDYVKREEPQFVEVGNGGTGEDGYVSHLDLLN